MLLAMKPASALFAVALSVSPAAAQDAAVAWACQPAQGRLVIRISAITLADDDRPPAIVEARYDPQASACVSTPR
jgi:hypothetical protein